MARGNKALEIKFRLDDELNEEIKAAAAQHGWGVSEEIRRRLKAGSGDAPLSADERTKELLNGIAGIADYVADAYGAPWHGDDFTANRVFVETLREALDWLSAVPVSDDPLDRKPKPGSVIDRMSRPIDPLNIRKLAQVLANAVGAKASYY